MQVFLVGGAVRDQRLGRPVADRDWVVVGATPQQLIERGYRAVGKDFPVFLHPQTAEEYALARTERKTGPGYHGFAIDAAPDVTLEDDLRRRDLTINAMAMTETGDLVDPYGGARDIEQRLLRHVSPAFAEDPVRILRVARFAARYASLGFRVAEETQALMRRMVRSGEVDHLVAERVWQELRRALGEPTPGAFIEVLRDCGALARLFPEIEALYGVPQRVQFHPEICTGAHTGLVLEAAARLAPGNDLVAWCALVHDLGKARTPRDVLPKHIGHEDAGLAPIRAVAQRLKPPADHTALALACCRLHLKCHQALELKPGSVLELLEGLDCLRRPERLETFLVVCEADKRGRLGLYETPYPQADFLRRARAAAAAVDPQPWVEQGLAGPAIGERLRGARCEAIAKVPRQGAG